MKKLKLLIPCILLIAACSHPADKKETNDKDTAVIADTVVIDSTFPELVSVDSFKNVDFVPMLNERFSRHKTAIYAATMMMAWDAFKGMHEDDVKPIDNYRLQDMDSSKYHYNVLKSDEYMIEVDTLDGLYASAYFRLSLPFLEEMQRNDKPLVFMNEDTVQSFTFNAENLSASLIYFIDKNDFALKFKSKKEDHEMILMKSIRGQSKSFVDELFALNKKTEQFKKARTERNEWRYYINVTDSFCIPSIAFNLDYHYPTIEGAKIQIGAAQVPMVYFYQQTAFVLNEKGAEVESFAHVQAASADLDEPIEKEEPQPRLMIFDEPFVIFLKRKDADYPYFAMYVANAELMVPFNKE